MNESEFRVIVEFEGYDIAKDHLIDSLVEGEGVQPGDTGFSMEDAVRDHSIGPLSRGAAEALTKRIHDVLPWARARVYDPRESVQHATSLPWGLVP